MELYGALRKLYSGDQDPRGLELEVSNETKIFDLLEQLDIQHQPCVVINTDGRILKPEDAVPESGSLRVFQPIHGG